MRRRAHRAGDGVDELVGVSGKHRVQRARARAPEVRAALGTERRAVAMQVIVDHFGIDAEPILEGVRVVLEPG